MDSKLYRHLHTFGFPKRYVVSEENKIAVLWGDEESPWYCVYERLPANIQEDSNRLHLVGARSDTHEYYEAGRIFPTRTITFSFLEYEVIYAEETIGVMAPNSDVRCENGLPNPTIHKEYWDIGSPKPVMESKYLILSEKMECDIPMAILKKHGMMG